MRQTTEESVASIVSPHMVRICRALLESGELSVGALAEALETGLSTTSQQLTKLRLAGLVASERRAQQMVYSLVKPKETKALVKAISDLAGAL